MKPIDVACPLCDAPPGTRCPDNDGLPHRDRVIAAQTETGRARMIGMWRAACAALPVQDEPKVTGRGGKA